MAFNFRHPVMPRH